MASPASTPCESCCLLPAACACAWFNSKSAAGQERAGLTGGLLRCRLLANNNISGRIPDSWTNFTSLQRLVVKPGNEYLCGPVPPNLPFKLCDEGDPSCLRSVKWWLQVKVCEDHTVQPLPHG